MTRGSGLVELLVGATLALVVLAVLVLAVAVGARAVVAVSARGEGEDTAHLAIEAFLFDARRAGFDPAGTGVEGLREALPERVAFAADLDADGTIDGASEEATVHVCAPGAGRLSRIIGRQSLPLAEGVTRCAFRYLDRDGAVIAVPPSGLDVNGRRAVRAVALDLTLRPPGLRGPSARTIVVALRSRA